VFRSCIGPNNCCNRNCST